MARVSGLTGAEAAKLATPAKGRVFPALPGVASPRKSANAAHRKLKKGIQKAVKDAGLQQKVFLEFRYYKNLDVVHPDCGCGCGTAHKKKPKR